MKYAKIRFLAIVFLGMAVYGLALLVAPDSSLKKQATPEEAFELRDYGWEVVNISNAVIYKTYGQGFDANAFGFIRFYEACTLESVMMSLGSFDPALQNITAEHVEVSLIIDQHSYSLKVPVVLTRQTSEDVVQVVLSQYELHATIKEKLLASARFVIEITGPDEFAELLPGKQELFITEGIRQARQEAKDHCLQNAPEGSGGSYHLAKAK